MRYCVFCGSSPGADPAYAEAAASLGQAMAERGIGLVYGGARVGLMGVVADAALAAGGEVIGVLPDFMQEKELAHEGLTELHIVRSMHERKAMMAELSAGVIALPGGLGTFEELFEAATWVQLGIIQAPCALLNARHYFDHLLAMMDHGVTEGFLSAENREALIVEESPSKLLDRMAQYTPSDASKLDRLRRDRT
ncbi:MAG: TIGR00730 family Rossman fold protein [Planctomycetota bacterium]